MPLYFHHIEGSKKGQVESFDLECVRIGRLPNNDLKFDLHIDREISGNHAEVYREGESFFIEDLQSTNGTYVNGRRIEEPTEISEGDVIEFSSRGPKVIFSTKEPEVGAMETLNMEAPAVGTLMIQQDQVGGLGVGSKTLGMMFNDALLEAKASQSGRFGATAVFVRELLRQASVHSSRRMRLTALSLAILLVLITGALVYVNYEKRKELDILAQKQKQQLDLIAKQHAELEKYRSIPEELKRKGIEAEETGRGVSVNLPSVLFEVGRSDLTPEGEENVKKIASVLKDNAPGRKVLVEGHASLEKGGQENYNRRLSQDRAKKIAEALARYGADKERIASKGFGSSRPVASNDTEEGRRQNRRVEVIIEK